MPTVRFAARDPGAANVLTSFLRRWKPRPPLEADHWTLPKAAAVFDRAKILTREFPEDFNHRQLEQAWDKNPAHVLITGTSHYAPFEPALWKIAKRRNCPSLAIIDYWSNVRRRFADGRPDAVGAIDADQAGELSALGFSGDQMLIVGQAWLSSLYEESKNQKIDEGRLIEDPDVRVLFVSEPIARDVASGANAFYGFDEVDSFRVLHKAACDAVRAGTPVRLAVKFHPYENPADFKKRTKELSSPDGLTMRFLDGKEPAHEWIRWSNVVAGISSVLLLEAIVLGKPVISVQPGLRGENTCAASRFGFARTLTDAAESRRTLTALMLSANEREALCAGQQPFLDRISREPVSPVANWIESSLSNKARKLR